MNLASIPNLKIVLIVKLYVSYMYEQAFKRLFLVFFLIYTDWNLDPEKYCTQFWPGWDDNLTEGIKKKYGIKDISKLAKSK